MTKNHVNVPKISIIIPSFNKVDYIQATLSSIVSQKYPNMEVIIQDGASTDGTIKIIQEFANKYPKIFSWVSEKDKGQTDAINKGCQKAKGDIIAYINADDLYSKNTFWEVSNFFINHPNCYWVIGFGNIIDSEGKIISKLVTKYKNLLINFNLYNILLVVNYISQPSVFLSRSAYKKFGPFIGHNKYVLEYNLWLKIAKIKMPGIIEKNLSSFRLTTNNMSSISYKELLDLDYKIVAMYTSNIFILIFHRLHNYLRIVLISLFKFNEKILAR